MILTIPAMDGKDLTRKCVGELAKTATGPLKKVVVLDNNSLPPYAEADVELDSPAPFVLSLERRDRFSGYYRLIKDIRDGWNDEILILMHNDLFLYEQGWDYRLKQAFDADPKLMLVGLAGSNCLDAGGGRGPGTMLWFRGTPGVGQPQSAGRRVTGLEPAVVLDSLFMAFRREAVDLAESDWEDVPISHYYDKIWSLRLVRQGYHVAVLGSECDHMGGMTCVANPRYQEAARSWSEPRGLMPLPSAPANWDLPMYLDGERKLFEEFGHGGEYGKGRRCRQVIVERGYEVRVDVPW